MKFKIARKEDLPELEFMFSCIVENMHKNDIKIWNEFYPFEEFSNDIENENLYLIANASEIIAAFGLYDSSCGQDCFEWENNNAKALYLVRLGINVKYLRQGIGSSVLKHALDIAKQNGATYLRLMVININKPAINFYQKNGFVKVSGTYDEFSESLNKTITEFGFEIKL